MSYILAAVLVGLLAGIALILKKNVGGAFAKALTTSRLTWTSILLFLGLAIAITIPKIGSGKEGENSGTATRPAQWYLRCDKPSGYKGDTPQRSTEFIVDVVKNENSLNIILNFQKGGKRQQAIFQGWKNGQGFRGTWNQPGDSGEWFLEFQTPDYAVGWLTDKKYGRQQPFILLRKQIAQ